MGDKSQSTVREHYVPKVYLNGFSLDKERKKPRIYCFDSKHNFPKGEPIPIDSIAFKQYLYEFSRDKSSEHFNYIEKKLGELEGQFATYRRKLIENVALNADASYFPVSTDELEFWRKFLVIQILRSPFRIKISDCCLKRFFGEFMTDEEIHANTLAIHLPFFEKKDPTIIDFYEEYYRQVSNLYISVGVSSNKKFMTSDDPVFAIPEDTPPNQFIFICFPVTTSIILLLTKQSCTNAGNKIICQHLNDEMVVKINEKTVFNAWDAVYSQDPFTQDQSDKISEIQQSDLKKEFDKLRRTHLK